MLNAFYLLIYTLYNKQLWMHEIDEFLETNKIKLQVEALNIEAVQYEEECWIYKDRRIMKVKSRNLTLSQFTEMTETSVFRQCSRDPSW